MMIMMMMMIIIIIMVMMMMMVMIMAILPNKICNVNIHFKFFACFQNVNKASPGSVSSEQARRLEAEVAEKQIKDRIQQRQANKDKPDTTEDTTTSVKRTLSASERRAIEAEKRAQWRKERMRELEEDALKAQIVIAQVKAMSASSLESLPLGSPDGPRKSSSSENELNESGLRRTSSSGASNKTT